MADSASSACRNVFYNSGSLERFAARAAHNNNKQEHRNNVPQKQSTQAFLINTRTGHIVSQYAKFNRRPEPTCCISLTHTAAAVAWQCSGCATYVSPDMMKSYIHNCAQDGRSVGIACPKCQTQIADKLAARFCDDSGADMKMIAKRRRDRRKLATDSTRPHSAASRTSPNSLSSIRRCGCCHAYVEKVGGCNHVTCLCGYKICWLCGGEFTSGHFEREECQESSESIL